MGNTACFVAKDTAISLVINNTTEDITIKKLNNKYSKDLKETVEYHVLETLGTGKHACFSLSELKDWEMTEHSMEIEPKMRVSFKGKNSNGVVLSVSEFESNAGIVLSIGENNQLVKELVSREEAKMSKQIKSSRKHEEELKQHLISIVKKRNTASTSQSS